MVASNAKRGSFEKGKSTGASEKQVAANRANAKKSTGPKTDAGKGASRMNAVCHGLCSTLAIFPGEDEEAYEDFAVGVVQSLKPRDHVESVLVDQYVSIAWKLSRLGATEAELGETTDRVGVGKALARELKAGRGPMLNMMALEDRLRGALAKTIRQIKELRALRRSMMEEDAADGLDATVAPSAGPVAGDVQSHEKGIDPDSEAVVGATPAEDAEVGAAAAGIAEKMQNEPNLDGLPSAQAVSATEVDDGTGSPQNEPNLVAIELPKPTEEDWAEHRRRSGW